MKKNVVHIIDGLGIGGAERMVFELATRMRDSYEVSVIGLVPSVGEETFVALEKEGVPVRFIEKKGKCGIGLYDELTRYLQDVQPDIVHTHLFASDVWGAAAAVRAHVPVVISTEHSVNRDEGVVKHRMKCHLHKKREAIVAISESVAEYVRDNCAAVAERVQVISNGVDVDRLYLPVRERAFETLRIVVVGRLAYVKGHDQLFAALSLVNSDIAVTIVGDGPDRGMLEEQVIDLGLEEKVDFVGIRSDVETVYAESDLVIVPSRWEGLGLSAIEGQVSGCAVIASDVDGLREIVNNEVTGLLVDASDPTQFAVAIDRCASDEPFRQKIAAAGQVFALEQYGIDRMIHSYDDLYKQLL